MINAKVKSSLFIRGLFLTTLLALGGCEDEGPTAPNGGTTTTTPPPPSSTGMVRAAQLTIDARTVDVAIDGQVMFTGLAYPGVSEYVELSAGMHRVQFFRTGSTGTALRETFMDVAGDEALTVAIATPQLEILAFRDDLSTVPSEARLKLFNAVHDYPANFDLMVLNGQRILSDVAFDTSSDYVSTIPGVDAFSLLRGGTSEEVAELAGAALPAGSTSTVFAVGSLGRQDIQLFVARDR